MQSSIAFFQELFRPTFFKQFYESLNFVGDHKRHVRSSTFWLVSNKNRWTDEIENKNNFSKVISTNIFFYFRWRNVKDDDDSEFRYLEQEVYTNSSSSTKYTVNSLQPFTVYSFTVAAINHVGRSRPSKNSYPSITLRERKML